MKPSPARGSRLPVGAVRRAVGMGLVLALAAGCGDKSSEKTASTSKSRDEEPSGSSAPEKPKQAEDAAGSAQPKQAAPAKIPDAVDDALKAIPAEASVVVSLPALSKLSLPKEMLDTAMTGLAPIVSERLGVDEATLRELIKQFDGGAVFYLGDADAREPSLGVVMRFADTKPVDDVIARLQMKKTGDHTYSYEKGSKHVALTWLPGPKVALLSNQDSVVATAFETLGGAHPAFAGSPNAKTYDPGRIFAFGDLHALMPKRDDVAAAGSRFVAQLGLERTDLAFTEIGAKVPRLGNVLAPSDHKAIGAMPEGASMVLDLSLGRRPGKSLKDVLVEVARATGADFTPSIDPTLKPLGLSLADLDKTIGESLTIGVYSVPAAKPGGEPDSTVAFSLAVRDEKTVQTIFDAAKKVGAKDKRVTFTKNGADAIVDGKSLSIRIKKDAIYGVFGEKSSSEKVLATLEKGGALLEKTPQFATFQSKLGGPSHLGIYLDLDALQKGLPMIDPAMKGKLTGVTASTVLLNESEGGIDLVGQGGGTMAVVGAVGVLATYGVKRYLESAKSAEAKNGIGAISRGAVAAYERESATGGHALCKSAKAAPAKMPAGAKVVPDPTDGKDFRTGSDTAGWKCLKFEMTSPLYYQYDYRQGGGYKCVARGGVDPGPNGFEASAEGDLDGDGKTSLFCITGQVKDGRVIVSPTIFTADENE